MLIYEILRAVLLTLILASLGISLVHGFFVPGTRARYVLSTANRAIGWAWVASPLPSVARTMIEDASPGHRALLLGLDAFALLIGMYIAGRIYSSDDDNWFSGRATKIKNRAARRLKTLTASPAAVPARN